MDFIPRLTKGYKKPKHLAPLVGVLEKAVDRARTDGAGTMQVISSVPPRHGKTETIINAIAWGLTRHPELTFGYATYNDHLAAAKSRKAMSIARRAGVQLASENVAEWRTTAGGGMLASGIMGTWTGHGVDVAILDDVIKNRVEAESSTYRNRIWEEFSSTFCTRIEPGGSMVLNMTRWHPDDLAGRLIANEGDKWQQIHLPAISDDGQALWPERWSVEQLEERRARVGDYTWASLYQGRPRPRGGSLFGEPHVYHKKPDRGIKAVGLDFAYSKKTSSDWSVMVVLEECDGKVYVIDVIRHQILAPEFKARVYQKWLAHGKPGMIRWYAYGPETGIGDFVREGSEAVPLAIIQAPGDHFIRAQPVAAAWNNGDILVPTDAPWLDEFMSEVCGFTGVNDDHDDQVDALGAAFDQLAHLVAKDKKKIEAPALSAEEIMWNREIARQKKQTAIEKGWVLPQ